MSTFEIGLLYAGVTLLVMFSGMPISFSLGMVATVFMVFLASPDEKASASVRTSSAFSRHQLACSIAPLFFAEISSRKLSDHCHLSRSKGKASDSGLVPEL